MLFKKLGARKWKKRWEAVVLGVGAKLLYMWKDSKDDEDVM